MQNGLSDCKCSEEGNQAAPCRHILHGDKGFPGAAQLGLVVNALGMSRRR